MIEIIEKLQSTTFQSTPLTNSRLKYLSNIAQITEDHISRIGLGLSISKGNVRTDWKPSELENENSTHHIYTRIYDDVLIQQFCWLGGSG